MKSVVIILSLVFSASSFAYTAMPRIEGEVRIKEIPVSPAAYVVEGASTAAKSPLFDLVTSEGEEALESRKALTIAVMPVAKGTLVQAVTADGDMIFNAIVKNAEPIQQLVAEFGGPQNVQVVIR